MESFAGWRLGGRTGGGAGSQASGLKVCRGGGGSGGVGWGGVAVAAGSR